MDPFTLSISNAFKGKVSGYAVVPGNLAFLRLCLNKGIYNDIVLYVLNKCINIMQSTTHSSSFKLIGTYVKIATVIGERIELGHSFS